MAKDICPRRNREAIYYGTERLKKDALNIASLFFGTVYAK